VAAEFRYEELYENRRQAGIGLAARVEHLHGRGDVVVLALPRGGVPVAFEVARSLDAPLDVFLVRKLGVPGQEELAMGAIATGGVEVLNPQVLDAAGISDEVVRRVVERETRELARRERAYRGDRGPPHVEGRTAVRVDDGLATGASMSAAIDALRRLRPSRIVVAVPVGPASTCRALAHAADEVACLHRPERFDGVGAWYDDFAQTTDEEVLDLLARARAAPAPPKETPW